MSNKKTNTFSFFQKKFNSSETDKLPEIKTDSEGRKLICFNSCDDIIVPAFSEIKNKGINRKVIAVGEDNLFPDFLVYLMSVSPKHGSIIQQKGNMISGEGFAETEDQAINDFLLNKFGTETIGKILPKISLDFALYNYCTLLVTWAKNRKNIARIDYLDASTVRYLRNESMDDSKPKNNDVQEPQMLAVCADWFNYAFTESKWNIYPEFSQDNFDINPTQVLFIKRNYPKCEYYSAPTYISGIEWALLEGQIASFHTRNIQNGFAPSLVLSFVGNPTLDEMEANEKELKKQFQGTKGAGKVIITYSQDKDSMPIITPINSNDSDERYASLMESVTEGVLTSHNITNPALFGVSIAGRLGESNADSLNFSFKQYQKTVISPFQKILEEQLNDLVAYNGATDKIKIMPYILM